MIALQADKPRREGQGLHQPLQDAARVGTAVDHVPQADHDGLTLGPAGVVRGDLAQQLVQEIEAAMNVADSVTPLARSSPIGRAGGWRAAFPEEAANHDGRDPGLRRQGGARREDGTR